MIRAMQVALAAAMALAALGAGAQDKVVRVGVLMPISGPGSYFGVMGKEGIELALEQLKGAVNGTKLEVQYEDSACGPLPATQAAKRLIDHTDNGRVAAVYSDRRLERFEVLSSN